MKTTKKILCVVLAVMMIASLAVVSFAEESKGTAGKITVTNAEKGQTYTLYKLFDATYKMVTTTDQESGETTTTKAVSYTVPVIPDDPETEDTVEGNAALITALKASGSPFTLVGDGSDGFYYVEKKAGTADSAVTAWLKNNIALFGDAVAEKECESGNTVVFDVPYGYYFMQPGNGAEISVNTNAPTVEIVDKNSKTPSTPDKTADKETVIVGDTVTYTASFKATNFYTQSASFTKMINEYIMKDTSKGLKDKTLVTAKWYTEYDEENGTFGGESGNIANVTLTEDENDANVAVANIPWSKNGTSLYPSPVYVVLTYTATVTEDIFSDLSSLTADNNIKVTYKYNDGGTEKTGEVPGNPKVSIPTIGISLRKVDSQDETITLEGAEFRLYKMDGNTKKYFAIDDEDVYTPATTIVVSKTMKNSDPVVYEDFELIVKNTVPGFDPAEENTWFSIEDKEDNYEIMIFGEETQAADTLSALDTDYVVVSSEYDEEAILVSEETKVVSWVTDLASAKTLLADNDYDTLEIYGLAPGTYELEEIKAPEGYKLPAEPFELIVAAEDGEYTVTFDGDEVDPQNNRPEAYTLYIANGTGSSLPSTGGAGTVAIIAAGTILFMAAAIVLVTKKRMYNEQ